MKVALVGEFILVLHSSHLGSGVVLFDVSIGSNNGVVGVKICGGVPGIIGLDVCAGSSSRGTMDGAFIAGLNGGGTNRADAGGDHPGGGCHGTTSSGTGGGALQGEVLGGSTPQDVCLQVELAIAASLFHKPASMGTALSDSCQLDGVMNGRRGVLSTGGNPGGGGAIGCGSSVLGGGGGGIFKV